MKLISRRDIEYDTRYENYYLQIKNIFSDFIDIFRI